MTWWSELQNAWRSQCDEPLDVDPGLLLKTVRVQSRAQFWTDMVIITFLVCAGGHMLWKVIQDFHGDWPWLVYVGCLVWVTVYILFNRWLQHREGAHYDESMLAHVELATRDIKHRMWMQRHSFWWYLLPIAVGCMIPPILFFAVEHGERPLLDSLLPLLSAEAFFVVVFVFVHWVMKRGERIGLEKQQRELMALRSLRETLLNEEGNK